VVKIEGHGRVSDPKAILFEARAKNVSSFIDGIEARKAVEIIEVIYTSAKENKPYYLLDYHKQYFFFSILNQRGIPLPYA
jgi:hypothetical protein